MVKARKPKKGRKDDPSRPSIFFIIAMILGFAVLIWWFVYFLPKRASEGEEKSAAIITRTDRVEALVIPA